MYLALTLILRGWRKIRPIATPAGITVTFIILLFHSTPISLLRHGRCYAEERNAPEYRFSFDSDDFILVPVELFDRVYPFVLDTGASFCVLDDSFKRKLGPRVDQKRGSTVSKSQTFEFFTAPEFKICTSPTILRYSAERITCADLSDVRSGSDREPWGILGMDFLQTRIVRLNFDRLTCDFASEASAQFTQVEPLQFSKGTPHLLIRLPIEGYKSFLIDSGGEYFVTLESNLFKKLVDRRKVVVRTRAIFSELNGISTTQIGILESIEFGSHRFNNVPVEMGTENRIGLEFLQRFEVEFDFPNRVAGFREGQRIDVATRRNWSGMGIRRVSGQTLAAVVDPSGVASQAGIRHDDQLRTVNGIPVEDLKLQKIRELLSTPGTEVTMTFERDQQSKKVVLVLPAEVNPFPEKLPHEVIAKPADFDK